MEKIEHIQGRTHEQHYNEKIHLAELEKKAYLAELELELLHPTILERRKQEIYENGLKMNQAQKEGDIYGNYKR